MLEQIGEALISAEHREEGSKAMDDAEKGIDCTDIDMKLDDKEGEEVDSVGRGWKPLGSTLGRF